MSELEYILSPQAIRDRSHILYEATCEGKTHFQFHAEKLDAVADYVVRVIKENYPSLNIPYHTRWNHFDVGNLDRQIILNDKLKDCSPAERCASKIDLVITSVLLDAGAGMNWKYFEEVTQTHFSKSEGLAIASFHLFINGAFSSDPENPYQADSDGLCHFSSKIFRDGFQVNDDNPLIGVHGRVELIRNLGKCLHEKYFQPSPLRPGNFINLFKNYSQANPLPARTLLTFVLKAFGEIWPGRIKMNGQNLGDVWRHPLLGDMESNDSLIPFHKLSQWLTYSLISPLEEFGIPVILLDEMTGLPEYRNGGLLLDSGLLTLKDEKLYQVKHAAYSELIVEWRALTIILLDKIAEVVRDKIGKTKDEFPLTKVLEGGTWWAGRKLAQEKRKDGGPPLEIESDGTVF